MQSQSIRLPTLLFTLSAFWIQYLAAFSLGKGVNTIAVCLDPSYPELASGLVKMILRHKMGLSW
jgi:hypothetical protein